MILTSDASMDPPIQQLNLLSVLPGTVGGTTSFSFMLGGVFILRSRLSLSVNPCISELPPETITLPNKLCNKTISDLRRTYTRRYSSKTHVSVNQKHKDASILWTNISKGIHSSKIIVLDDRSKFALGVVEQDMYGERISPYIFLLQNIPS